MTRRTLLQSAAAAGLPLLARAAFEKPIGVQLYTVRSLLPVKGEATLKAIAAIGYREVEIGLADAKKFAHVLKETGLKPVGSHIEAACITGGWEFYRNWLEANKARTGAKEVPAHLPQVTLEEQIETAKQLGVPAIGVAFVVPQERNAPQTFWPKFADQLNGAGEACRKAGLSFFYHHHNFEFEVLPKRIGLRKERPIDVLREKLSKDVALEIDCFWASVAGEDPARMITAWKDRIFGLHLKDKAKGTPVSYETDRPAKEAYKEVGKGVIDWKRVIAAAKAANVQHYFVEQDYTAGDPLESLRQSYAYLSKV